MKSLKSHLKKTIIDFDVRGKETQSSPEEVQYLQDGERVVEKDEGIVCLEETESTSHEIELCSLLLDGISNVIHAHYGRAQNVSIIMAQHM